MTELSQYQRFIHLSRYARWRDDLSRRETWEETVDRYVDFFREACPSISPDVFSEVRSGILNLESLPSMRALMSAGPALKREAMAGFNCAGIAVMDPKVFSEALWILMNAAGLGFSVERQFIAQLPQVPEQIVRTDNVIVVEDSKEGWAGALDALISALYRGELPTWDLSRVRPAGARLKTFGGRASGPAPLNKLFLFTVNTFQGAKGRKLTSLECHDLMCVIAEITKVGGVRRSATISLSNLSDERLRHAKSGEWWVNNPQRALANNSAVYTDKPDMSEFAPEWLAIYESKSGERGIFNRQAATAQAKKTGRRDFEGVIFVTNPCAEALLLHTGGLCNLSEIIVREDDTEETLLRKARLAAILGTMQSTLTHFGFVRPIWRENAERERLLGVSLTGIMDNRLTNGSLGKDRLATFLDKLREHVVAVNREFAEVLGITPSVATTVIKPSGTVSALCGTASGIHPRHDAYYYRRVRGDKKDPLSQMMYMSGIPCEDDVTAPETTWVFTFPMKSPEGCVTRGDITALDHLELYRIYCKHWTEQAVSITVSVREHEWLGVGDWVYKNFDDIVGVSFLPMSEHTYLQAPFESCSKDEYDALLAKMPELNWELLSKYELEDSTSSTQESACSGGNCEIV